MTKYITKEKFLETVKNHKLEIISRNGLTRHIRIKNPESYNRYYDLTTWQGHLCISGDMRCYVFSRHGSDDMFNFFRNNNLDINPNYQQEKLVCESNSIASEDFSQDVFNNIIKEYFEEYFNENDDLTKKCKEDCWNEIEENLLNPENEHDARNTIYDCGWANCFDTEYEDEIEEFSKSLAEYFCDGIDLTKYTNNFIWCLYAIVYGIQLFDKLEEGIER